MNSKRKTSTSAIVCLIGLLVAGLLQGCGTRVWGEGGGGQRPWGGVSIPLGDGK